MKKANFVLVIVCFFSCCFGQDMGKIISAEKKWKHSLIGKTGLNLKIRNTQSIYFNAGIHDSHENDKLFFCPNLYLGFAAERKFNQRFSYSSTFSLNMIQINRNSYHELYEGGDFSEWPTYRGYLTQKYSFFSFGVQQGFSVSLNKKFEYSFNLGMNISCFFVSSVYGKNDLDGTDYKNSLVHPQWPVFLIVANNSVHYKISNHHKIGLGAEIYPGASLNFFYSFLDFRYTF